VSFHCLVLFLFCYVISWHTTEVLGSQKRYCLVYVVQFYMPDYCFYYSYFIEGVCLLGCDAALLGIWLHLPIDTTAHHRSIESLMSPLWKPKQNRNICKMEHFWHVRVNMATNEHSNIGNHSTKDNLNSICNFSNQWKHLIKHYNLYKVLACSTTFFQLSLFCTTFFQLSTFMLFISSKMSSSQRVLGLPMVF
jgi:hypothetical protein